MSFTPTIALAAPVHQPDKRLTEMIAANLPKLAARYSALTARCSKKTHPTVLDLLHQQGVTVHVGEDKSEGIHNIGDVRKETLRAGLQIGTSYLQLCDFDRAIHWVAHYPQELEAVIADIPNHDMLVLGRTERAWATHPPYQAETEPLFNKVFALATGRPWDVGAGSRGFSRRGAEAVLAHSREQSVGTDAEWPLLLLNRAGFNVSFRACEGLEFETADRFGPEIAAAGGYEAWEAQICADPERWVFRMELALLIAQAVVRFGRAG